MKPIYLAAGLALGILVTGCSSAKQTSTSSEKNNVVSASKTRTVSGNKGNSGSGTLNFGSGGNDEIIFKGNNNLFEIISKNAAFFDQHHEVIIIEGDNNIIKLYNVNLVDMRGPGSDTLMLVGNNQKYVMDVSNSVVLKKQPSKTQTIRMETEPVSASSFTSDFDKSKALQLMLENYREGLAAGDPDTYFRLAKVYHFGLDEDIEPSITKAIDLYQYAAVKNHLESICKLGEIYANESLFIKTDKVKAIYYFTLGANLDDEYSKERLQELRGTR